MFIKRADAWNAEKSLQFVKKTSLITAGKIHCRGSHTRLPFWRRKAHLPQKDDRWKRFSIYPAWCTATCELGVQLPPF